MKRFITLLASTLLATAALAQPAMDSGGWPSTITVNGTGKVTLTPDRFSFTVGVQTMAPTVEQAVNENNTKIAAVIAALKKAGAGEGDIRTSNFSVWPQQDYREGQTPRILGYQVMNNVTVRRDKIADAGRLLQVAVTAGVNQASNLNFEVSDPARGRDKGLKAAFEDARSKAMALAQASGKTLGPVMSMSEGSAAPVYPYPQVRAMAKSEMAVSDVPVDPGTQEASFTVTVVFSTK
jgi:uncharacterized protein